MRNREQLAICEEEARREGDAAREAPETFERNFAKLLDMDDTLEEETKMIAAQCGSLPRVTTRKG